MKENLVCLQKNPDTAVLTQMELKMKELTSALSEVHAQEHLVRKDLEALKQLYRGELEFIDGMSLELCLWVGRSHSKPSHASPQKHSAQ